MFQQPFGVSAEPFWKIVTPYMKILSIYQEIRQEISSYRHTIYESGWEVNPGIQISLQLLRPQPAESFCGLVNFCLLRYRIVSSGLIKFRTYFSIRSICEFLFSRSQTYLGTIRVQTVQSFLYFFAATAGFYSSAMVAFDFWPSFLAEVCSAFLSLGAYSCLGYYFPPAFYFFFFYFLSYFTSGYPVASFSSFSFFFNACFYFHASVFFLSTQFVLGFFC